MLLMLQARGLRSRKPGFVAAEKIKNDGMSNTQVDQVVDRLRTLSQTFSRLKLPHRYHDVIAYKSGMLI